MSTPAIILILVLAVAIVAAYFYLKRRQQQIAGDSTATTDYGTRSASPDYTAPPAASTPSADATAHDHEHDD
jgi:hypothetical protein